MVQDRRHFQRVELDSPWSVLLDESMSSLMFDLCEVGLAVDGLALRRPGEVIPFAFDLPESSGRIQGSAEVVWTNESEYRTGLHILDLADPSRKQLAERISASAYMKGFVGIEKESIQQTAVTLATRALVSPISQDNGGISESRSGSSLHLRQLSEELDPNNPDLRRAEELNSDRKSSHRIVVALALVFLSSVVGFIAYHSGVRRNNLQAGDSTSAAKSPEMPSEDTTAPVKSLSEATAFSTPPARLDLPGFVLQVGAMRQEANADALAKLLQEKTFPAFVFRRGTNRFYRVAVGPYSRKDSAVRVKYELEKEGLKAFLRRWVPE